VFALVIEFYEHPLTNDPTHQPRHVPENGHAAFMKLLWIAVFPQSNGVHTSLRVARGQRSRPGVIRCPVSGAPKYLLGPRPPGLRLGDPAGDDGSGTISCTNP
jgi:hypothetical protein